jgi:sterol 3beta-glucosyltransferase
MPYWGRKAAQLGVALPPIPFKELSVARLAAAIRRLTQDSGLRARAHAFGEQIRGEDGVGRAVAAIEQYLRPQSAT